MSEKINELSPEMEARLSIVQDKWHKIALSTDPSNREMAEHGADMAYRALGLTPPKIKIWLGSPIKGYIAAHLLADKTVHNSTMWGRPWNQLSFAIRDQIDEQLFARINTLLNTSQSGLSRWSYHLVQHYIKKTLWAMAYEKTDEHIFEQVRQEIITQLGHEIWWQVTKPIKECKGKEEWQNMERPWPKITKRFKAQIWRDISIQFPQETGYQSWLLPWIDIFGDRLEGYHDFEGKILTAQSCGWWWALSDVVIFTDRPTITNVDNSNRPHSAVGAAIEYPDGMQVHAWHGIRLPKDYIESPVTVQKLKSEPNVELRRILMEIHIEQTGTDNILKDFQATILDDTPCLGLERKLVIICDDTYLYCTNGSIEPDGKRRKFLLGVPTQPFVDWQTGKNQPGIKTAHEASAWTYGIDPKKYEEQVRT